jgi:hypothetical protein
MAKTSRVPSGFYNGKEAAQRLGLPVGTFYHQVKTGRIEKVIPPGSKEGYYPKKVIDKLAQARELFVLLNSIEPIMFERAVSEEDIKGIYDLTVAIYGIGGTPSYEERLKIWHKNPYVYYVVRQENIVVGYISLIWFTDEALQHLMRQTPKLSRSSAAGNGIYSVTGAENVRPFIAGHPIDSLFISLAVRPGMTNTEQRSYSFKLLRDTLGVLETFALQGMIVKKLYATSERSDGIRLARKLGMKETKYEGDNVLRYELDLETTTSKMLLPYQEVLKEIQSQTLST